MSTGYTIFALLSSNYKIKTPISLSIFLTKIAQANGVLIQSKKGRMMKGITILAYF